MENQECLHYSTELKMTQILNERSLLQSHSQHPALVKTTITSKHTSEILKNVISFSYTCYSFKDNFTYIRPMWYINMKLWKEHNTFVSDTKAENYTVWISCPCGRNVIKTRLDPMPHIQHVKLFRGVIFYISCLY